VQWNVYIPTVSFTAILNQVNGKKSKSVTSKYVWKAYDLIASAENLILSADHKTVKLADFGLAREESLTEMMTAETGTYRWMAPEVTILLLTRDFSFLFAVVLSDILVNE